MNWIQGNMFKSLADFKYAPINNMNSNDYRYLVNTLDTRNLQDNDIIYTHTFYIEQLFELLSKLKEKVIIVSHNADTAANIVPPDNVIMWFTTNVDIGDERVKSIPIGIENDIWLMDKKVKMEHKLTKEKIFKNLLYMNHNIKTNPAKRQRPYNALAGKSWVTSSKGANGMGFDAYLDNIYNHPFVVCPEGNGIDTHRVWECLYMQTIPIQIRNINNSFYTDLPILFIDDWEELSDKMLHDQFMKIVEQKWNLDKLDFNYWRNEIYNEKN